MKTIKLPSTFSTVDKDASSSWMLDLNLIFWEYLFSTENVRSLFNEYISRCNPPDEFKSYLDFIVFNLKTTNLIKKDLFSIPFGEKRALYCFKTYFFILSIFNKINKNYQIDLSYGVVFNCSIEDMEFSTFDNKNIVSDIFYDVLNNNSFFENNAKYILKINWENDSYVLLLLAHMMRKKFDNIEINVDLSRVDEQADYSFWKSHYLFNKYIDSFENTYYEDALKNKLNNPKRMLDIGFGNERLATRMFDTKCYWGKCSFCSINSHFISEKKVANLSEYAIKVVDSLINDIEKIKGLSNLFFADEAIEASILVYFAEQLLKHNISMRWSVRSRFSDKFTLDNCRLLARSGLRFLGFGLESVNQRILKLMNKRERECSKEELNAIFENCDKSGINVHAYFIIGFPSETKQETDETLEFVDHQLKNRNYFTYAANVFSLMRGSYVYEYPEEFNIEINDEHENAKLSDINFVDNNPGEQYTLEELTHLSHKAYAKLFFKEEDIDHTTIKLGYNFSNFLARTPLIYESKLTNSCNPFLYELNIDGLSNKMLDQCFKLLPLFISNDNSNYKYYNILDEKKAVINEEIRDLFVFFVNNFRCNITLRNNIKNCYDKFCVHKNKRDITQMMEYANKKNMFEKHIIKLIKNSLLYTNKPLDSWVCVL